MKIKVHNGITSNEEFTVCSKAAMKNQRTRSPFIRLSIALEMLHQDPHSVLSYLRLSLHPSSRALDNLMTLKWFDFCN